MASSPVGDGKLRYLSMAANLRLASGTRVGSIPAKSGSGIFPLLTITTANFGSFHSPPPQEGCRASATARVHRASMRRPLNGSEGPVRSSNVGTSSSRSRSRAGRRGFHLHPRSRVGRRWPRMVPGRSSYPARRYCSPRARRLLFRWSPLPRSRCDGGARRIGRLDRPPHRHWAPRSCPRSGSSDAMCFDRFCRR